MQSPEHRIGRCFFCDAEVGSKAKYCESDACRAKAERIYAQRHLLKQKALKMALLDKCRSRILKSVPKAEAPLRGSRHTYSRRCVKCGKRFLTKERLKYRVCFDCRSPHEANFRKRLLYSVE